MTLTVSDRQSIVEKFGSSPKDSGSAEVQVAVITARLGYLQDHFSKNKKDHHSRRGLLQMVGRRRRLLDYIKAKDVQKYRDLIAKLNIRK